MTRFLAKNVSSSSTGCSDPVDELVELKLQKEFMQVLIGRRGDRKWDHSTVWVFLGLHAHRPVGVATATPCHHQWAHERQNWTTGPVSSALGDIKWT